MLTAFFFLLFFVLRSVLSQVTKELESVTAEREKYKDGEQDVLAI